MYDDSRNIRHKVEIMKVTDNKALICSSETTGMDIRPAI